MGVHFLLHYAFCCGYFADFSAGKQKYFFMSPFTQILDMTKGNGRLAIQLDNARLASDDFKLK